MKIQFHSKIYLVDKDLINKLFDVSMNGLAYIDKLLSKSTKMSSIKNEAMLMNLKLNKIWRFVLSKVYLIYTWIKSLMPETSYDF
jgi:hypothetical protein